AVRTRSRAPGEKPGAEEAHRSATLLHLGNIAIRTGRTIAWDAVAERVVGDAEANRLVDVPMRAPWHL
ncbi:MAG: gfo/Idh/MocA family oxidoreductase, partial [Planctomycetes bacterium]|nr:gfo/Idh/MocA family oxidoreductase [Planctomycetota bacterium]